MIEAALAACQGRVSGPFGAAARLAIPRQILDSRISASDQQTPVQDDLKGV
jgi:hypothetical protein